MLIPRPSAWFLAALIVLGTARAALAGPPYATDDPVPTDYRNWEIYSGADYENALGTIASRLPFLELNYGLMPNVQVSASFHVEYAGSSSGATYGYDTTELGLKTRFVQETAATPQVSFYPSVEGGGGEPTRVLLPVWMQKSSGKWTLFGGGGAYLSSEPGDRGGYIAGAALTRDVSATTNVGFEVYRTREDALVPTTTAFNVGAIAALGKLHAIVFSVGRSFDRTTPLTAYAAYEFMLGPRTR